MDKEKAIEKILELKTAITKVRALHQEITDPGIEGHPISTALVKSSRKLLKGLDMKAYLDAALDNLVNPTPNHKLEKIKRYKPGISKSLSPCFIPEFGFQELDEDGAEKFIDRFAAEGWGNTFRMLILGAWNPEKKISFPYLKDGNKFQMKKFNPSHFDSFFRRGDFCVERYVMPIMCLQDNTSQDLRPPKHSWHIHPFNGLNNVNGTHTEPYSMTHHYEYDGTHPKHNYIKIEGMAETRKFCFELFYHALMLAKERWGDFFGIEILNEGDAKNEYHTMLYNFIAETLNQSDLNGRLFTSMEHDEFYASHTINKLCIPIIHKVGNYDEYKIRKKIMLDDQRHGASQDGRSPIATAKETKENVLKILRSESLTYEGNLRPIEWPKICGGTNWKFNDFKWELFSAYGEAFDEYLEEKS